MNNSLREQKKTCFYGHSKMPEPKPIIKMIGYYYLLELSDTLSLPRHKASSAVCLQICSSEHFVCISNLLHLIMNPSGYKLYIHFYFVLFYICAISDFRDPSREQTWGKYLIGGNSS